MTGFTATIFCEAMDKSSCPRNPDLCLENRAMWVKQCHLHHPQLIIVFVGGMFTIPKCVVHDIVLPTENSVFHSIPLVFPWYSPGENDDCPH